MQVCSMLRSGHVSVLYTFKQVVEKVQELEASCDSVVAFAMVCRLKRRRSTSLECMIGAYLHAFSAVFRLYDALRLN